ncbi:MAG: hypothetical protein KF833_17725 [Verrucomicrobiae bacterium]|nr:hypothetical protein [Verrucomicrobiae bacterium]
MPGPDQKLRFGLSGCVIAGTRLNPDRQALRVDLAGARVPVRVEAWVRRESGAVGVHPVTIYRP